MHPVRKARVKAGMSAARLALRLGVHESTVRRWEYGMRKPSEKTLDRVARVLGVSVEALR